MDETPTSSNQFAHRLAICMLNNYWQVLSWTDVVQRFEQVVEIRTTRGTHVLGKTHNAFRLQSTSSSSTHYMPLTEQISLENKNIQSIAKLGREHCFMLRGAMATRHDSFLLPQHKAFVFYWNVEWTISLSMISNT